jgi:hypothetical protein
MTPPPPCCHHLQGPARGPMGPGNMRGHRPSAPRSRWTTWGPTVAAMTGTPVERRRTAAALVTTVLTRRCHGGPLPAMVAACGREERTVAAWWARAGQPGAPGQPAVVQPGQVARRHVQADDLWGKRVGRRGWMAMARAAPSRLGLGGIRRPPRAVVRSLAGGKRGRACGRRLASLVCVDGRASEVPAVRRGFRPPVRTGRPGRPRRVRAHGVRLGHVVKRSAKRRVRRVERRGGRGREPASATVLTATPTGTGVHTASIERRNPTFRASLAPLVRRGRAIAHPAPVLTAGMWRVGCRYPFCAWHASLRQRAPAGAPWKWQARTPAMAAGRTPHRWTMRARLRAQGPLPAGVAPRRRGRPPTRALQPAIGVAT